VGLFKILIVFLSFCTCFAGTFLSCEDVSRHILYLMQAGHLQKALTLYKENYAKTKQHDHELIQQIALTLLDQGFRSTDPEIQLLTAYGAGIATNEKALYILEDGMSNPLPQIQLIAMNFLAQYQNDRADEALNKALASPYLIIRLEASAHLAEKKYPKIVGQLESLLAKLDPELIPLLPQLFALVGDPAATKVLKRLLNNSDEKVRIESILSCVKHSRDDLLPQIRTLATHHEAAQQEACAYALGIFKDEKSIPRLQILSESPNSNVRLAALIALYKLGKKDTQRRIEAMANARDLFAINALGEIPGSEPVLYDLMQNTMLPIKINSALALLERKDPRCLPVLVDVLIKDSRDLAFVKTMSPGKGLYSWKIVPSARQNFKDNPVLLELSLNMREETLEQMIDLPEIDFLKMAHTLFEVQQNDLIPVLVDLLENLQTPSAIKLLKLHQQKAGAPLIRNYCNLALYRLKESGPYGNILRDWVAKSHDIDFIKFRTFIPWEMRDQNTTYQLTPQEVSRLLIESFEAFVNTQDDKGIEVLLEAIQNGNAKNKYALAGLLIRAAQ
jgi:HEAT repeat protein